MTFAGWVEFLFIALLAFVIIGPKDFPKVLYSIGRFLQSLKKMSQEFMTEFEGLQHLDTLEEEAKKRTNKEKTHL